MLWGCESQLLKDEFELWYNAGQSTLKISKFSPICLLIRVSDYRSYHITNILHMGACSNSWGSLLPNQVSFICPLRTCARCSICTSPPTRITLLSLTQPEQYYCAIYYSDHTSDEPLTDLHHATLTAREPLSNCRSTRNLRLTARRRTTRSRRLNPVCWCKAHSGCWHLAPPAAGGYCPSDYHIHKVLGGS
jgi:hypothetical protein